jgi:hypothetical protein
VTVILATAGAQRLGLAGPVITRAVRISEIRIDQPGSDIDEYFELAGPPGTSLDGLTYVVIGDGPGGSGTVEEAIELSGLAIPDDGHFVAVEESFTLVPLAEVDLVLAGNGLGFENGDNVTHRLVLNFTGRTGMDLDVDDDCLLDELPWEQTVDTIALVDDTNGGDCVYGEAVGPDGGTVPAHVYRCEGPSSWTIGAVDPAAGDDTPGAPNPRCQAPCSADLNGDQIVDVQDLIEVILAWGTNDPLADIDGDGTVDVGDLIVVVLTWGPCP